ncbi:MAG: class I SAM-dependent methyltransferase [Candidatus Binatia bacterium]
MSKHVRRLEVREGYDQWASTYDTTANPLVALDRRYTLRFLRPNVGERILDAGCGTGWNLQLLRRAGSEPTGIDFSYGMLAAAQYKNPTAPLAQADLNQALPVRKNVFDAALCALVGEHLTNLSSTFRELFAALRPGGRLVFSVFHPEMAAVGKESNFEQEGVEYRLGAYRYSVTDYLTVLDDCGFCGVRHHEFRGDQALLDEVPSAIAFVGQPLLLVIEARREI